MTMIEVSQPLESSEWLKMSADVASASGAIVFYYEVGSHVVAGLRADSTFSYDEAFIQRKEPVLIDPIGAIIGNMEFGGDGLPIMRGNDSRDREAFTELVQTLEEPKDVSPWEFYTHLVEQALSYRFHKTRGVDPVDANFSKGEVAIHAKPAGDVKNWIREHVVDFGPDITTQKLSGTQELFEEELLKRRRAVVNVATLAVERTSGP